MSVANEPDPKSADAEATDEPEDKSTPAPGDPPARQASSKADLEALRGKAADPFGEAGDEDDAYSEDDGWEADKADGDDSADRRAGGAPDPRAPTDDPGSEPIPPAIDALLARAERAGVTPEQVEHFGSEQALELYVTALERHSARPVIPTATPAAEATPAAKQGGDPRVTKADIRALFRSKNVDPDRYEDALLDTLQELLTEKESMKAQLEEVTGRIQGQAANEAEAAVDTLFAQQAQEYAAEFGKGAMRTVTDPQQRANRQRVFDTFVALANAEAAADRPVHLDQIFQKALRAEMGPVKESVKRQQALEQARNRAGQFIARPSPSIKRNDVMPTGRKRAIAGAARFLREHGVRPDWEDDGEDGEI